MHPGAKVSSMPLRNAGKQIGGSGQSERGRKATGEDCGDFSFQPERLESLVNWVLALSSRLKGVYRPRGDSLKDLASENVRLKRLLAESISDAYSRCEPCANCCTFK